MEQFLQAVGLAVIGAVLALVLGKHTKEMSILLTMGCAVGIVVLAFHFLEPVVDLVTELRLLGELQQEHVSILLKAAGMSLLTEFACGVCEDVGQSTLGKMVRFCGNGALVYIGLPLLRSVVEILKELLGG